MSQKLESFLDQAVTKSTPGISAWAARGVDARVLATSNHPSLPVAKLKQVFTRLVAGSKEFEGHGIEPLRFSWAFERGRIYLAVRLDGSALALFVEQSANPPTERLDAILQQFLELPTV